MNIPQPIQTLPKHTEGAKLRFFRIYSTLFKGEAEERVRLLNIADTKINTLVRKAPRFDEQNLPLLINQVASLLLTYDVNTQSGQEAFHKTHRRFLQILDELINSQPAGEINFDTEVKRIEEKERLLIEKKRLNKLVDSLEASEVNVDDIPYDDGDLPYQKMLDALEENRKALCKVSIMLAALEGERFDENKIEFELLVKKGQVLEKLEESQISYIQEQILEFLKDNQKRKKAAKPFDIEVIKAILAKIDTEQFNLSKEDKAELPKEILSSFRRYFRELDIERRNDFFDSLCRNKSLRPKEGIILESPNDVPNDVRERLEASEVKYKRELDALDEEFSKKPYLELEVGEAMSDEEKEEGEEVENEFNEVISKIKQDPLYQRVKEEQPSDDDSEEDEFLDDCEEYYMKQDLDRPSISYTNGNGTNHTNGVTPTPKITEPVPGPSREMVPAESKQETKEASKIEQPQTNGNQDAYESDDDCCELGIVEPAQKIQCIDLVDSD